MFVSRTFFLRNAVEIDDILGDDDRDCCKVGVQLGDFDLAAATKNEDQTLELLEDRYQLVVVL